MRESTIEKHFVSACRDAGILQRKLQWVNRAGAPDRAIIHRGRVVFVELKAPGEQPTTAQLREHEKLRAAGVRVLVVDSIDAVDAAIAGARS